MTATADGTTHEEGTAMDSIGTHVTERAEPSGAFLGFATFVRKELHWWWSGRAAIIVFAIATLLGGLSVLGDRLTLMIATAQGQPIPDGAITLDPTLNVLNAQWDQWLIFITIFVSMGLLTTERESGTLAWSLSKPLARTSLLLGKWTAAVVMLGIVGIVLPMLVGTALALLAYGGLPDLGRVGLLALLMLSVPAFFLALTLALGTWVRNQGGIAGIAFAVAAVPLLVGMFLPTVAQMWPTSIGGWSTALAAGGPIVIGPPLAWIAGMVIVAAGALGRFAREDL
jgi:ABC-type transport system involved in multi-copper enzyme maturation permease subunit